MSATSQPPLPATWSFVLLYESAQMKVTSLWDTSAILWPSLQKVKWDGCHVCFTVSSTPDIRPHTSKYSKHNGQTREGLNERMLLEFFPILVMGPQLCSSNFFLMWFLNFQILTPHIKMLSLGICTTILTQSTGATASLDWPISEGKMVFPQE